MPLGCFLGFHEEPSASAQELSPFLAAPSQRPSLVEGCSINQVRGAVVDGIARWPPCCSANHVASGQDMESETTK